MTMKFTTTTTMMMMMRRRKRQRHRQSCRALFLPLLLLTTVLLLSLVTAVHPQLPDSQQLQQQQQQQLRQNLRGSPPVSSSTRNLTAGVAERIVGGRPVNTPYPFFIEWTGRCGGSLIHEDIMLTAAHCDRGENPFARRVYVGGKARREGVVARSMAKRIPHPAWDASLDRESTIAWDFLVVKLNETTAGVDIDDRTIAPLSLNANDNYPVGGERLTAIGYGHLSHTSRELPNFLRHVDIQAFSNDECHEYYGNTRVIFQEDSMMCAGVYEGGKSTCQGDSGGPLIDENQMQVGVVSWGEGCGAEDFPGVFSRVSAAQDWIQEQICRWSCYPPPTCSPDIMNECARPQTTGQVNLTLRVVHDRYPAETAIIWEHYESATELFFQDYESFFQDYEFNSSEMVVEERNITNGRNGTYHLLVADSARDGICCSEGQGSVSLINTDTGETLYFNNTFLDTMEIYIHVDEMGNILWNATEMMIDDETDESGSSPPGTDAPESEPEVTTTFNPEEDKRWPGEYPTPGATNTIAINIRYDDYPEETNWVFERKNSIHDTLGAEGETVNIADTTTRGNVSLVGDSERDWTLTQGNVSLVGDSEGDWTLVDQKVSDGTKPEFSNTVVALEADNLYRFTITDQRWDFIGDGTCCEYGQGWVTITNGTEAEDNSSDTGTVMWTLLGNDFTAKAEAFFWVQSDGLTEVVDYARGSVLHRTEEPFSTSSPSPEDSPSLAPDPSLPPASSTSSESNGGDTITSSSSSITFPPVRALMLKAALVGSSLISL